MTVSLSAHDPATGRFSGGNSAYLAKQRRIEQRFVELCAEYEDSPAQRQILRLAAGFMDSAERCRTEWKRTRAANTAAKLLRSIPRKQPKRPRNAAGWYENDE
jgi:hypothetical protein